MRLVGGQGVVRKDEWRRPGEVIRRCCGSHGSSRSPRSRRGRSRWANQKRTPTIMRFLENISHIFSLHYFSARMFFDSYIKKYTKGEHLFNQLNNKIHQK